MVGTVSEALFFVQVHSGIEKGVTDHPGALVKTSLVLGPSVLTIAQSRGAARSDLLTLLPASGALGLLGSLERYLRGASPDPSVLPVVQAAAM